MWMQSLLIYTNTQIHKYKYKYNLKIVKKNGQQLFCSAMASSPSSSSPSSSPSSSSSSPSLLQCDARVVQVCSEIDVFCASRLNSAARHCNIFTTNNHILCYFYLLCETLYMSIHSVHYSDTKEYSALHNGAQ